MMEMLKNRKTNSGLSTIWENKYVCAYQYIYATALYLLSILAHAYNVIIDHSVGSPGYGREVVDGLNMT